MAVLFLPGCVRPPTPVQPVHTRVSPTSTVEATATMSVATATATEISRPGSPLLEVTPSPKAPTPSQTVTASPLSPTMTSTPGLRPTLAPEAWKELPVVPVIQAAVMQVYRHGLELGNNPRAFSKIGDCGSTPAWFLGDFDRGSKFYRLGAYQELEEVIQYYRGSFLRTSLAARSGFNASSVFAPLWSDRSQCKANEAPLACEYRVHRPVIAFIMLGSNDVYHQDVFEDQMRKIIEFSMQQGVIPILSTKADNLEGDHSLNNVIARLAMEYEMPLWNYWLALQSLPNKGLQEDGAHITWGPNRFDDPSAMKSGWAVRNLTALQVLYALWQSLNSQ